MIEVQLLGNPAIKRDGAATPPPKGRKAWGLLVYLLLSEVRNPSREHLAGLLFADTDDPLRSLRWNLFELRRALGKEVLEPGGATIELPPDARVDVFVLLRGSPHEALAIPGLARPLLEGMEFEGSPAFDSWIGHERRRLEGASCSALHESVLDRLAAVRSEEAVVLARRLVELEPFDENFQEVLIRALAQAGDEDGARRQLEACRSVFRVELGREPAESLERAAGERPAASGPHSMGRSVQHAAGALIEAGEAAVAAGAADAGLQNLRRALSLANEASQGELEVRARVALGSALVHAVRGRDGEAASVLGRAAILAAELGLPDLESAAIHLAELFADRVDWQTLERELLEITAFERPRDCGEYFKARYGPTIAARANAAANGREQEFDDALDAFCDEWNRGTADDARFEKEYLISVGTRT